MEACLTVKKGELVDVVKSKNTVILTNNCNCSCVCFKHRVPIAIGSCTLVLSGVIGVTRSVYIGQSIVC